MDVEARHVKPPAEPRFVLVNIDGADVEVKDLRDDGRMALALDPLAYWRRVGTVGQVAVLRNGLSVRQWRAASDSDVDGVTAASRKAAVAGMLAMLGMVEKPVSATSEPLF